jgi:hypothetical protein
VLTGLLCPKIGERIVKRVKNTQVAQAICHTLQAFFMRYGLVLLIGVALMLFSDLLHAKDLLATALEGDVKDTLGAGGMFWKILTLISIVLATVAAVGSKNPLVFMGVFGVVFIPSALVKIFVF